MVYSVANYRFHVSHFWASMKFLQSQLNYFLLYMYLILIKEHFTFHLQYKHSGMFAICRYEELSYAKKMCFPILVTIECATP